MKHVFFVHGHITYYMAKSVQQYKKIADEDCLLLLARKYKNEFITLKTDDFVQQYYEEKKINSFNFFHFWKYIKITDNKINELLNGEEYVLYLPHFNNPIMQILATNKKCVEVNIMEEGSPCYSDGFLINPTLKGLKQNLNFYLSVIINKTGLYGKGRFVRLKASYDTRLIQKKLTHFYTISNAGYLPFKNKRIVIPFYKEANLTFIPKYSDILILEGGVEQKMIDRKKFYSALEHILQDNPGIKQVSLKFHPAQNKESIDFVYNLLQKHNIEYEVIPGGISMEQMLLKSQKLNVYGFASSLLLYALMMGHNVISYDAYLKKTDTLYRNFRLLNDFDLEKIKDLIDNKNLISK